MVSLFYSHYIVQSTFTHNYKLNNLSIATLNVKDTFLAVLIVAFPIADVRKLPLAKKRRATQIICSDLSGV